MDLQGLKEEGIRQLIIKNYDITNELYLDRIYTISKDNPRLAVMAAEVVKQHQKYESIRNVSELYHQYFSSIVLDLEQDNSNLKDSINLKVAAIISFFNTVDTTSQQQMEIINHHFKITKNIFLEAANKLFELEIVDIYESEVIKVSDQILATYLFYLCFFKERSLNISELFGLFGINYIKKFEEAIYPILNVFGIEIVKDILNPILRSFINEKGFEEQLKFLNVFWFVDVTSTLVCVNDYIEKVEYPQLESKKHIDDDIISLLGKFRYAEKEDFYTALELIFKYLEKSPECLGLVIKLFTEKFSFNRNSHREAYENQVLVLEFLDTLVEQSNKLAIDIFFELAKVWLKFEFEDTYSKGNQFVINKFGLLKSKVIFKIRKIIWHRLYFLYSCEIYRNNVVNVYEAYAKIYSVDKKLLRYDLKFLLDFFDKELSPDSYLNCNLVRKFLNNIEKQHNMSYREVFNKFSQDKFEIFNILLTQYFDLDPEIEYDQFDQYRIDSISDLVAKASNENIKKWFDEIGLWNTEFISNDGQNNSRLGGLLLRAVGLQKPLATYLEMLCYWEDKAKNGIDIYYSVKILLDKLGYSEFIDFIKKSSLNHKSRWFFEIFSQQILIDSSKVHIDDVYNVFIDASVDELPHSLDFLLSFMDQDSKILESICKIILEKETEKDPYICSAISNILWQSSKVFLALDSLFLDDNEFLEKIYLHTKGNQKYFDYEGVAFNKILDRNALFIDTYLDNFYDGVEYVNFYSHEREINFDILWRRNDYQQLMIHVLDKIYKLEKDKQILSSLAIQVWNVSSGRQEKKLNMGSERLEFALDLMKKQSTNPDYLKWLFNTFIELSEDDRLVLIKKFIEVDQDFDRFRNLQFQPRHESWSGSRVPILHRKIEYWEKIAAFMQGISLMKHKQYAHQMIQSLRESIKKEQKRDFLNSNN